MRLSALAALRHDREYVILYVSWACKLCISGIGMFFHGMNRVESMDIPMQDYSSQDLFLEVVTRLSGLQHFADMSKAYIWGGV